MQQADLKQPHGFAVGNLKASVGSDIKHNACDRDIAVTATDDLAPVVIYGVRIVFAADAVLRFVPGSLALEVVAHGFHGRLIIVWMKALGKVGVVDKFVDIRLVVAQHGNFSEAVDYGSRRELHLPPSHTACVQGVIQHGKLLPRLIEDHFSPFYWIGMLVGSGPIGHVVKLQV
jgi:hypothetical protein